MRTHQEKTANPRVIPHPAMKDKTGGAQTIFPQAPYGKDGFDALFMSLGRHRPIIIAFIRMKLDKVRRQLFTNELEACRSVQAQSRCVRRYIRHLKINDLQALLQSLPDMLSRNTDASSANRPGDSDPNAWAISENQTLLGLMFFLAMPVNDS